MKTRNLEIIEKENATSACCGSSAEVQETESDCCEQPSDGSSCCDKSASKEENQEKTGCC